MSDLITLITRARKAGLTLDRDGSKLSVRGDRRHEHLVRAILNRKAEVLGLVDVYAGRAQHLDWRSATVAEKAGRCVLCRKWSLLRDPYDRQPCHKTCAERAISPHAEPSAGAA